MLASWLLLGLLGCEHGLTLPSDAPERQGPLELGTTDVRERKALLPGFNSSPPPPEPALRQDQCRDLDSGGPTDGCLTADVRCGETIVGHTRGGARVFDSDFYKAKFCTPNTTNHDGGDERVYRLRMPDGDWRAIVTLDTPCADLDLAGILWNGEGCPTAAHSVSRCDMWPKDGTKREQIELVSQRATTWLLAVEGKNSEEGAFALSVQCYPGLH